MYRPQDFSIPDSIIFYITKNPSSLTVYQKLIKCCKYFYFKNPILLHQSLYYYSRHNKWYTNSITDKKWKEIDITSQKIWVTNILKISFLFSKNLQIFSLPNNIQSNVETLILRNTVITVDQLLRLGSSIKSIEFYNVTVMKDDDGNKASFSDIIQCLPMIEKFSYNSGHLNVSSKNIKELINIPQFQNIKKLELLNISEEFDIDAFYQQFLKKNTTMDVHLRFNENVSVSYKQRIEAIIDKILAQKSTNFWPPYILHNDNGKMWQLRFAHHQFAIKRNISHSCS